MGIEEHEHAEVAEVTLSKSVLVQAMYLGVGKDVSYSLDINYHHITMGILPGEVAECLSNQGLIRVLFPPCIVVILLILPRDVGLTVIVFVRGALSGNLIDESLDEFDEILRVNFGDKSLVKLIDDELANEDGFEILLHHLQLVGLLRNLLWQLNDVAFLVGPIIGLEGVAHGSLSESSVGDFNLAMDRGLLDIGSLPVDLYVILGDEERVAHSLVLLALT